MNKEISKAGVYCRVSTTKDAQEESIEQQEKNGIKTCKEMDFTYVESYSEKRSATETQRRAEYQKMLIDMETGKINVIVVKDIYRLNRSNLDWYVLVDTIRKYKVKIYFYLDKQFYSDDRALEYNVRQLFGAEYPVDLSKKVNKAHRERQESGRKAIFTNNVWGYKTISDENGKKHLVIVEEEAEMIKLIFQYYIQGYGCHRIAKMLFEKGYVNANGKIFGESVILSIIKNPKVTGTIIMNTRHRDFYTKQYTRIDEAEWITKENVVPAIINKETWEKANKLLNEKSSKNWRTGKKGEIISTGRYEGKKLLSQKLFCGLCGAKYYVNPRKVANGKVYDWLCSTTHTHSRKTVNEFKEGNCIQSNPTKNGCDNIRLKESDIVEILDNVAKKYFDFEKGGNILGKALDILRKVFIEGEGAQKIISEQEKWNRQLAILENREKQATIKLLDSILSDEVYKKLSSDIKDERDMIKSRLETLDSKVEEVCNIENRLKEIEKALREGLLSQATSYSVLEWSEKLLVYPDRLDIILDIGKLLGSSLNDRIGEENKIISVSLEQYKKLYCESGMKKTNDAILENLKKNPKITQKELSAIVGLSVVTVYSRLRVMKEKGIIFCYGKGIGKEWKVIEEES